MGNSVITETDIISAHKFSSRNRSSIAKSLKCGCFYCLSIFPSSEIVLYVDSDQTAICPHCGIDSVLCDVDIVLTEELLRKMNEHWF